VLLSAGNGCIRSPIQSWRRPSDKIIVGFFLCHTVLGRASYAAGLGLARGHGRNAFLGVLGVRGSGLYYIPPHQSGFRKFPSFSVLAFVLGLSIG
jgi:hypothetical protein